MIDRVDILTTSVINLLRMDTTRGNFYQRQYKMKSKYKRLISYKWQFSKDYKKMSVPALMRVME